MVKSGLREFETAIEFLMGRVLLPLFLKSFKFFEDGYDAAEGFVDLFARVHAAEGETE